MPVSRIFPPRPDFSGRGFFASELNEKPCHCEPVTDVTGVAIRTPRPPWLPLWGSCHEVTERVNSPSPPLRGTSPIGRGKTLVRLALAGDARASSLYTREPGMLLHRRICLFQQYFYAGKFIMAGGAEEDRPCSERGSGVLEENRLFSPGASLTPARRRGRRRRKLRPGFAGKGTQFLQYPGRPAGDSGGFWIFSRYPNWTFRDSGHFCPRKIRLRPLLLFETGRIQTATVAQLGQE